MNDFPANILQLVQQQIALQGRIGATRIYQTPDSPAIPFGAGGVEGAPLSIRFTDPGWVLALYAQEIQGTPAAYAQVGLRLQIDGTQDFVIDGNGGPAFNSLLSLVGGVNNWFPIMRKVRQGDLWIVTFKNNQAATAATPSASFAFMAQSDVDRMVAQNKDVRG